ASGSLDKTVRLWDVKTKELVHTFEGHQSWVYSVAFGPRNLLASGSLDKTVRVWDVNKKTCLVEIKCHSDASSFAWQVTSNGVFLVIGGVDGGVQFWQVLEKDKIKSVLRVSNYQTVLNATGVELKGAKGLSSANRDLLIQRGAKVIEVDEKANKTSASTKQI